MRICRATELDSGPMWAIFQAVVGPGDTLPFPADTDRSAFEPQWLGGELESYVAVIDERVVGMYQYGANRSGRGAHVATATYAVHPGEQGKGVGRALVEHSLAAAASAGYLAMQYNYVVGTNAAAIRLYEQLGFAIVGTLPKAFRHQTLGLVDAHVMYRFL